MTGDEKVVKHLEMIQGIVNRLGSNSFFVKGWSMAILAAAILFISRDIDSAEYIILAFIVPVLGFWLLDAYFLWQERMFRGVYNDVRKQETTDFVMNIPAQKGKPGCSWRSTFFSITLGIFYGMELLFIGISFIILLLTGG